MPMNDGPARTSGRQIRRALLISTGVFVSIMATEASALEASLSALYRTEYGHNVSRVESGGQDSWSHLPGLTGSFVQQTAATNVGLNYTAQRRFYVNSDFSDQTIASGNGFARWSPIQERWDLFVNNTLTYTTIDNRLADRPGNTQLVGYTSAGTDLQIPLFSTHYLTGSASYGTTTAQRSDTNSDRYFASVGYAVDLSELNRFAINGGYTNVSFDNPLSNDYQSNTISADYSSSTRVLDLFLSGGYTEIDRDGFAKKIDGFVGGVNLTWKISESSSLGFTLSQNFQDNYNPGSPISAVGGLQSDEVTTPPTEEDLLFPTPDRTNTNDIYRTRVLAINYANTFGLTSLNIGGSFNTRVYDTIALDDEERTSLFGRIGRQLPRNSQIDLSVTWDDIDYTEGVQNDKLIRALIGYSITLSRRLSLNASAAYENRNSNLPNADYDYYSGAVGVVFLLYGASR